MSKNQQLEHYVYEMTISYDIDTRREHYDFEFYGPGNYLLFKLVSSQFSHILERKYREKSKYKHIWTLREDVEEPYEELKQFFETCFFHQLQQTEKFSGSLYELTGGKIEVILARKKKFLNVGSKNF